ncbi:MAG: hypothetical protein ABSH15_01930 [Verrucomicrobiota bacterium]|jgi:hypothetical protein
MNDLDLDKKLKAARVPARDEDYWESFPRLVSAKLRSTPAERPAVECHWLPRLAWVGGIAFACLMIGFAVGHWRGRVEKSDPYALLQNEKALREVLTLFPNRVRAIVQDEHGVQLVLADQADVPASTPIYVHICNGKQCSSLVTFSGQELEIAGQKVTILSDAQGSVIVAGSRFAWSSDQLTSTSGALKIEAKALNSITL